MQHAGVTHIGFVWFFSCQMHCLVSRQLSSKIGIELRISFWHFPAPHDIACARKFIHMVWAGWGGNFG